MQHYDLDGLLERTWQRCKPTPSGWVKIIAVVVSVVAINYLLPNPVDPLTADDPLPTYSKVSGRYDEQVGSVDYSSDSASYSDTFKVVVRDTESKEIQTVELNCATQQARIDSAYTIDGTRYFMSPSSWLPVKDVDLFQLESKQHCL